MSNDITISVVQVDDLSDLMVLYQHLHPGEVDLSPDDSVCILGELSRFTGSGVFIARLGARLISTVTLVVVPNLTRNGMPYALVENVVTDPAYRGRGFGGRLLKHAISVAWEHGCYKVMLMTGSKDPSVLRFYGNIGFEQNKTGFQIRQLPVRAS